MFDVISYVLGRVKGKKEGVGTVVLEGNAYTFVDRNQDSNIEIEEESDGE